MKAKQSIEMMLLERFSISVFLAIVLVITVSATGLNIIGSDIPILRQVVGFLFLTVIPGAVILRILKLRGLNIVDVLLYSVGLSISFVMFLGVLVNALYPIVGILRPLSTFPVIITFASAILLLCIVAYKRESPGEEIVDSHEHDMPRSNARSLATLKPTLFLISLPILSTLGATLLNFYGNPSVELFLLAILPTVPIIVLFDRIPRSLYPLAVVSVAISLLFHNSLVSMHLVEWADGTFEYYFASLALKNSFWNLALNNNSNTILSTVILGPLLSEICNLSLEWVFKIVYPILFSVVPLGIYRVVQKQTNDKIAFLSSFFFASTYLTFTTGLGEARFQIASLFLVMLLHSVVNKKMSWKTMLLSSIFLFSLIVSHYALAALFTVILIIALGLISLARIRPARFLTNIRERNGHLVLTFTFGILCVIFLVTWFMNIASASLFNEILGRVDSVASSFFSEFSSTSARGLSSSMINPKVPLLYLTQIIYLVAQFFIFVGLLEVFIFKKRKKINAEYLALSIAAFVVTYTGLIVPLFAFVGMTRLYHMNLLFLSPFCVIGGMALYRITANLTRRLHSREPALAKRKWINNDKQISLRVLSMFFAVYLLLSTGLVFWVADTPVSFSLLSINTRTHEGYCPHFSDQEVTGATWLSGYVQPTGAYGIQEDPKIYPDFNGAYLFMFIRGVFSPLRGDEDGVTTHISSDAYIFLGRENTVERIMRLSNPDLSRSPRNYHTIVPLLENSTFYNVLLNSNKIYDTGETQIFYRGNG